MARSFSAAATASSTSLRLAARNFASRRWASGWMSPPGPGSAGAAHEVDGELLRGRVAHVGRARELAHRAVGRFELGGEGVEVVLRHEAVELEEVLHRGDEDARARQLHDDAPLLDGDLEQVVHHLAEGPVEVRVPGDGDADGRCVVLGQAAFQRLEGCVERETCLGHGGHILPPVERLDCRTFPGEQEQARQADHERAEEEGRPRQAEVARIRRVAGGAARRTRGRWWRARRAGHIGSRYSDGRRAPSAGPRRRRCPCPW